VNLDALLAPLLAGTGLDAPVVLLLCGVSYMGSFITASMGIGGGALVLATMALFLPPPVLIPLHGFVQLGSNMGRVALMARHVVLSIVPAFLLGTVIGALIGGNLVIALPLPVLQFALALFILYSTWAPKIGASNPGKKTFFSIGLIGTIGTMFFGATGPLMAPFIAAACGKRQNVVATHATLMAIQHGFKVITFGVLGFAFVTYLPLLVALLVFGFAGTWTGKHVLHRLPEKVFRTGLKILLTLISLRLLYGATSAYFAPG